MTYKLDKEELLRIFRYDRDNGELFWKHRTDKTVQWNGMWPGKKVGCTFSDGYIYLKMDGKHYALHHIIWILETGEAVDRLDHRDLNRSNNRFDNLRPADAAQNRHNIGPTVLSKSGVKGVCFDVKTGRWQAQIGYRGKKRYLGQFDAKEDAARAYAAAALIEHGTFARVSG